jgi:hypothetical protein
MSGDKLDQRRRATYQSGSQTPMDPPSDGTCPICQAAGNGQARSFANATQELPRTNVHHLYECESKQEGMEEQGNKGATSQNSDAARQHYLSQPNELDDTRTGCANQWSPHHQKVQVRNRLHRPRQPGGLCTSTEVKLHRGNDQSQRGMGSECQNPWRQGEGLPRRQWNIPHKQMGWELPQKRISHLPLPESIRTMKTTVEH